MRVILIGRSRDRARLRSQLNGAAVDVLGEFATIAAARAADIDADALLLSANELAEGAGHAASAENDGEIHRESLTPREIQVLELVAEGLPNKAIAERLHISDQTVKFHVASIAGKLGAVNRTDVVRRAVRRGIIAL